MPRPPAGRVAAARRAAAAVEFAVVAVCFFTFVLAAIELGRALMVDYILVNAARQGCRTGMPPGRSTADIRSAVDDALARGRITGATVTVQVNDAPTDAGSAVTGDRITVIVRVPVSNITWVPFTRYLGASLAGQYTLRRE